MEIPAVGKANAARQANKALRRREGRWSFIAVDIVEGVIWKKFSSVESGCPG